jgi:organic radical activating enzyme
MAASLDHQTLYRLPWSLPDNAISWLEPTSQCNLACDGCYRENVAGSHKSLAEVGAELDVFERLRRADGISIAGGDPLMHPEIVEIVRMIAERGVKPVINTNGNALTPELLRELKRAGVYGFTFHVDSRQGRPQWKRKTELELCALRLQYAEMLAEAGGIACAFNSTVFDDTKEATPDLLNWAARHIDKVHGMVFILFRSAVPTQPFEWYVGGKKVTAPPTVYSEMRKEGGGLTSRDLVALIRERLPDFQPCAYLNGSEEPDSIKWLVTGRVGSRDRIYGYVGPRFLELVQTAHHFWKGRYLAYSKPSMTRKGRSMMLLSPFDRGVRRAAGRYLASLLTNPLRLFHGVHYQTVMIIQPIDFLQDGRQSMCDSCPDLTVWDGKLVWSCRLEEMKMYGSWVTTAPVGRTEEV